MDKELKAKWIKALRSGKYQQTQYYLKRDDAYCCLGILHKVATGKDAPALWDHDKPACVIELGDEIERALAGVNDDGVPFEVIAGLIDEAL